jgi:hypothetical protein
MSRVPQTIPPVNRDHDCDWRDRAAQLIARRFSLSVSIAKVVVVLAGIGGERE